LQRCYSRADVRGLVLLVDETKPFLAVGAHLHLISEAHVMFEVPAEHADIVGDLVDLVALFSPGQDDPEVVAIVGRQAFES
jgi:hypothetical protein